MEELSTLSVKFKNNKDIISRLHRIMGQLRGVELMINEEKECNLIIPQIMAIRSALGVVAVKLLTDASCKASSGKDQQKFEQLINQLIKF